MAADTTSTPRYGITASHGDGVVELGDGGFTTWTAQLMGNAKERSLVSCISIERLAVVARN